jgi:hypothetical protein
MGVLNEKRFKMNNVPKNIEESNVVLLKIGMFIQI